MMNLKKIGFVAIALTIGYFSYASIAPSGCGVSQCKGGDDKCCTTAAGDTFYTYRT
ncbi:MAG: hypothetical protein WCK82_14405 [Bacteroidota bacterium]